MWAYGEEPAYLPELIARFDVVSRVTPARLVVLTASDDDLRRRFAHEPDEYHGIEIILRANQRVPSLLPLVPRSLPALPIDASHTSIEQTVERVEACLANRPGTNRGR